MNYFIIAILLLSGGTIFFLIGKVAILTNQVEAERLGRQDIVDDWAEALAGRSNQMQKLYLLRGLAQRQGVSDEEIELLWDKCGLN